MPQSDSEPEQIILPFEEDEDSLRNYFRRKTGRDIVLRMTDNAASMISVRRTSDVIFLRLHRMFLAAGDGVLREVADFIRKKGVRTPLVREFIKANAALLKSTTPRSLKTKTGGRYHDLLKIFEYVNATYFGARVRARITWGTAGPKRAVRRRTLGSFSSRTGMIRINPILDKRSVPAYFVEFIVYHEMLHADLGCASQPGKRRCVHHKEFRRKERLFRDYDRAISWEKNFFS